MTEGTAGAMTMGLSLSWLTEQVGLVPLVYLAALLLVPAGVAQAGAVAADGLAGAAFEQHVVGHHHGGAAVLPEQGLDVLDEVELFVRGGGKAKEMAWKKSVPLLCLLLVSVGARSSDQAYVGHQPEDIHVLTVDGAPVGGVARARCIMPGDSIKLPGIPPALMIGH